VIRELVFDSSELVSTVEGLTKVESGILYTYDSGRSKWLSKFRTNLTYCIPTTGRRGVYLRLYDITPAANTMGFLVPYDATITALTATRSAGTVAANYSVRVYGAADLTLIGLAAYVMSGYDGSINVDISAGTILSSYLTGTGGGSDYPQLIVEIARRAAG
jgi:hypothetical protein